MKLYLVSLAAILLTLVSSCKKDEPCYDMKFEITGATTTLDLVKFKLVSRGNNFSNPDEERSYTNLSIPYSEEITLCKEAFDYNLTCTDADTNLVLTLSIYSNGTLLEQSTTGHFFNTFQVGGGIND